MEMKSLKRSKSDKKKSEAQFNGKVGGEDFPWGTRMTLDHDTLSKLGVTTLPKVGSKMKVHGIAHVTSTSEDHEDGGKKRRRVELQMHHMGIGPHTETDIDAKQGAKDAMDEALDHAD